MTVDDQCVSGKTTDVQFRGELRHDQNEAVQTLLQYDNGVLAATTAFGKTVAVIGSVQRNCRCEENGHCGRGIFHFWKAQYADACGKSVHDEWSKCDCHNQEGG